MGTPTGAPWSAKTVIRLRERLQHTWPPNAPGGSIESGRVVEIAKNRSRVNACRSKEIHQAKDNCCT
jgi:hypothetical protein